MANPAPAPPRSTRGPSLDPALDTAALLECARELVRASNENPPGDERAATPVARLRLEALGGDVAAVEPAPGRISLVGTLDPGRPGPTLAINGHLDTVPAGPLDPGRPGPTLAINGHLDTVPAGPLDQWEHRPTTRSSPTGSCTVAARSI